MNGPLLFFSSWLHSKTNKSGGGGGGRIENFTREEFLMFTLRRWLQKKDKKVCIVPSQRWVVQHNYIIYSNDISSVNTSSITYFGKKETKCGQQYKKKILIWTKVMKRVKCFSPYRMVGVLHHTEQPWIISIIRRREKKILKSTQKVLTFSKKENSSPINNEGNHTEIYVHSTHIFFRKIGEAKKVSWVEDERDLS